MNRPQRFVGYALVAVGALSIFVGASPLFPIGLEAFLIGGVFFAAGAWVLAGKELRTAVRRALAVLLQKRRETSRGLRRGRAGPLTIDPLLPVRILRLAKDHEGIVTVALVAIELNVPLDHAEAGLAECVRAGNAIPDYDITHAHALYKFPEFLAPEPPRLSR
jgi:DNA-binding transcriptional LysR family regulator